MRPSLAMVVQGGYSGGILLLVLEWGRGETLSRTSDPHAEAVSLPDKLAGLFSVTCHRCTALDGVCIR